MARLTKEDERKKFALMSQLHLTEAEALDVIEADKEIDRGEKMEFDLDEEHEKVAKEYAKINAKKEKKAPTVYKFDKRERKKNATKQGIIEELAKFLTEQSDIAYENVVVTNAERQIAFSIGEDNFELTLVQKRKPK
jgi:hypothetical protein